MEQHIDRSAAHDAERIGRYRYGNFGTGSSVETYGFSTDDTADPVLRERRAIDPKYRRLSGRPFRCTLVGVGRAGLHFELETFEGDVSGEVAQPDDFLAVALPLESQGTRVLGAPLAEYAHVFGPGTTFTGTTNGIAFASVDFQGATLARIVESAGIAPGTGPWLQPGMVPLEGETGAVLTAMLQDLAEVLHEDPERLAQPALFAQAEWDFTAALRAVLATAAPEARVVTQPSARARLAIAAHDFIEAHARERAEPLPVADICARLATTERTLQNAFVEQFGVTFREMERTFRLQAAHEAILAARPNESVTDIAVRYGFWHLGRFSQYYRETFGRLPSETVAAVRTGRAAS